MVCKHQKIANAIESVCIGNESADVLVAISMVLGAFAAQAKRPDFDGLMRLVTKQGRAAFELAMEQRS